MLIFSVALELIVNAEVTEVTVVATLTRNVGHVVNVADVLEVVGQNRRVGLRNDKLAWAVRCVVER